MKEKELIIRKARMEDLPEILELEKKVWTEDACATEDMYKSRIETFNEGTIVAVGEDKIVGIGVTEILNYSLDSPIPTWEKATAGGYIKNHDSAGNSLYGVNLAVAPDAPRGTAAAVVYSALILILKYGLQYLVLGGRMPSYHKYAITMSPQEYVNERNGKGRPLDPELAFYLNLGFEIVRVMPEYFPDPPSLNHGVLLVWHNKYFGHPCLQQWKNFIKM